MELRFVVTIDVPERGGRRQIARAARALMLKLAAEMIRCSVETDDETAPRAGTTKTR